MFIVKCLKDKDNTFTQVRKSFIFDSRLRMKTRFLLTFLISKPDSWCFNYPDILKSCPEGIYSIRSSIRELIKFGYISHTQDRLPDKRFSYSNYMISETPVFFTPKKTTLPPHVDFPHTGSPHTGSPHADLGNTAYIKTKILREETTTTKPTKVVNTKAGVVSKISKEENIEILSIFCKLGIMPSKKMFDNFNNHDILKYSRWMYNEEIKANNPTGYLISALQRKFVITPIPEHRKKIPGHFVYQCKKCLEPFGYDSKISNYELCNTCAERKF